MIWANNAALHLWKSKSLQDFINKDFSSSISESSIARNKENTQKVKNGEIVREHWTFYPEGKPVVADCAITSGEDDNTPEFFRVEVVSLSDSLHPRELRGLEAIRKTNLNIAQFDTDGNLIFQNPIAFQLFEEKNIKERIMSVDFFLNIVDKLDEKQTYTEESFVTTSKGKKWMYTTARLIPDSLTGKLHILLSQKDITNEKEMEAELKKAELSLVESAKFASLGRLADGVAHEINNPNTIIKLSAESVRKLREENLSITKIAKKMDNIISSSERITNIVKGLKIFSQNETGLDYVDFKLTDLIQISTELIRHSIKDNNIDFNIGLDSDDSYIYCKSTQISQIIINLINNSIDAVNSNDINSPVKLQKKISLNYHHDDKFHFFTIIDNGAGIDKSIIQHIFDPFYSTKAIGSGTGLGLSISQSIARDHQGEINYRRFGSLSHFVLTIPKNLN